MTTEWRVFTWSANPNGGGYIVASTVWDNQRGPQAETYKVLANFDGQAEAKLAAEAMQQQYDTVRKAFSK
jgi:hypothetical protein